MSRTAANVVANFVGRGGSVLLALTLVPFYVQWMGIEAYGLISVYTAIQALVSLFDMGFSSVLVREAAKSPSMENGTSPALADLLRTLEVVIWVLVVAIVIGGTGLLPHVATGWVNAKALDEQTVRQSFALIACTATTRLPIMLYTGLLTGLQRQVLANTVLFFGSLLRGFGSIGVLLLFDNSVVAFFSWQLIGNLLELGFAMYAAWATQQGRFLAARFTLARLKENRRFAGGVVYITLTAALIAQIDKLVFSKLLSLEQFGYYALGATVAYGVFNLVYPICIAASPKFTHLLHSGETRRLSTTYHQFAQMCTVMAMPAVVILVAYAPDALALYLQDRDHALKVDPFLRLITLGVAAAALAPLPHTLQIAGGWTRLVSACNTVFALLYLSALLLITPSYGVEVALVVWIVLNAAYLLSLTWFMHQRILPGEFHVWLFKDVGVPAALGVAVCYLARESLQNSALPAILQISVSYTAVLVATMCGCMHVRRAAWRRLAIFVRQA